MKVGGIKTWKELTTGVQPSVRLLFNNDFINFKDLKDLRSMLHDIRIRKNHKFTYRT